MRRRKFYTAAFVLILTLLPVLQAYADLTMGIFPRRPASLTFNNFKPLADYLSQALDEKVTLDVPKDFPSFWQKVERGEYDLVHYNQYHYIKSCQQPGYQVIVANQEFGKPRISATIYVKNSSPVQTLTDLKGKTLMLGGGKSAMISYIVPLHMMQQAGLKAGIDYTIKVAKNPPNTILGLYYNNTDAAGTGDVVVDLPIVKNLVDTSSMRVIAQSDSYPHLPWAVKSSMPIERKEQIRQLMFHLNDTEAGQKILQQAKVDRFLPVTDDEYDMVRETVLQTLNEKY